MHTTTIRDVDLATITAAFTTAYTGYFVPLIFADAATATYLRVHDVVPEASPIWFKDGTPVAIGALRVRGKRGWIGAFGIAPEYRGKGLAQAMFGELVRLARQQGVKEVTLEMLEENVRARAIYERAGFKATRKLFSLECASIPGSNEDAEIAPVSTFVKSEIVGVPAPSWQRESRSIECGAGN